MPKGPHEVLHHLFRDEPDLVRRGLKECLGEDFPVFTQVSVIDSDLSEVKAINRSVDTALLVKTDEGAEIVVIEPQTKPPNRSKVGSWHWYLAYLEAYYKLPTSLIILTPETATANACRQPLTLGPFRRASATVHPYVIGPDNTPLITDPVRAADDVMLSVLAALTHRRHPSIAEVLDALAEVLAGIDIESAKFFAEYTEVGLGEGSAQDYWRSIIMTMTYPYASKLREELEARGEARGEAKGLAKGLLRMLDRRGIELSDAQRELVRVTAVEEVLLAWIDRSFTAADADEIFGPPVG
ncbi:hypothetical protein GCM10029992_18660 [Glycomyces albus]